MSNKFSSTFSDTAVQVFQLSEGDVFFRMTQSERSSVVRVCGSDDALFNRDDWVIESYDSELNFDIIILTAQKLIFDDTWANYDTSGFWVIESSNPFLQFFFRAFPTTALFSWVEEVFRALLFSEQKQPKTKFADLECCSFAESKAEEGFCIRCWLKI